MTPQEPRSTDPRLVGALLALALDAALLIGAGLLVLASMSAAMALVLTGTAGLVVAPLLGWQYGERAVSEGRGWRADALRSLALIGTGFVVVFAGSRLVVPVEGGIGGRVSLAVYALLVGGVAAAVVTLVVADPMGYIWTRLMRWASRRPARR